MNLPQEHYIAHLTAVSKSNTVILTEDVLNHRGILVVTKGTEVDKDCALKIAKHKLMKPLDLSICLTSTINQKSSFEFFISRLNDMKLSDIVRQNGMYQDAFEAFHLLTKYPLITQKLTVLAERMPNVFASSLLNSVMSLSLCKELQLSKQTTEHVFLANIISDVGLLHINPDIVFKEGLYGEEERMLMQGHVVIAKYFADLVPNLPKAVSNAVFEHHERPDGFGYPFSKHSTQLCIEGQVLAMVDKVSAIYRKLVTNGPHSWTSVIAVMQVPSTAHNVPVHKAMMRVLKTFPVTYKPAFTREQFERLTEICIEKPERLNLWFKEFKRIYIEHEAFMTDSENFKPLKLYKLLEHTVVDSGALTEIQHTWLIGLTRNLQQTDFLDIEEFSLVLDEVEYQCFFVMRKLVSEKEELIKRFNGIELINTYYRGLMCVLQPEGYERST